MPDFPAGPLFGLPRYTVSGRLGRPGFFHLHLGALHLDALPAACAEEQINVLFKSINYAAFDPDLNESFAEYVQRRRDELRREASLLANYHEVSAHVPQIIDVLAGTSRTDPEVTACGMADDEPCLVLERIEAQPLGTLGREAISQAEALDMAEELLMLLRVFHTPDTSNKQRYFLTLAPNDVLVDRSVKSYWLRNLWKLRTQDEYTAAPVCCDPALQAFVSPAIVRALRPSPPVPRKKFRDMQMPDLDLYSLGVILYYLLCEGADISNELPGFLDASRISALVRSRGLDARFGTFLTGLAEHRFHKTQDALAELCGVRGRPEPPPLAPAAVPAGGRSRGAGVPAGTVLGKRYEIVCELSEGGQGCVYLGRDRRTGSSVTVKVTRYRDCDRLSDTQLRDLARRRRDELLNEARTTIRIHNITSAVPQLLDVVFGPTPDEHLARHPEPEVSDREPFLVLEYIAGRQLGTAGIHDERKLLRVIRSVCGILHKMHQPDDEGTYYLYVDWKPGNIVWHPETGDFTMIDLGATRPVVNGKLQGSLASTDPYAGPEEYLPGRVVNYALGPTYDVHGLCAVIWDLAVCPGLHELARLAAEVEAEVAAGNAPCPVLDVTRIPLECEELRPIVEKGLLATPADRFDSADELGRAAHRALGRLWELAPEIPLDLQGVPLAGPAVQLTCRLPLDPFCDRLVIHCDRSQVNGLTGRKVVDVSIAGAAPGSRRTWVDKKVDPGWAEAHYAAFAIGYNGKVSPPRRCLVKLIVDPKVKNPVREENALRLKWAVPAVVAANSGQVVVERLNGGAREIYAGLGSHCVDAPLDPARTYRYRIHSRLPYGRSSGVEVEGTPLPTLAHFTSIQAVPDAKRIRIQWSMSPHAADRIVFLRSHKPLPPGDNKLLDDMLERSGSRAVEFAMDSDFRVTGARAGQPAALRMGSDGQLHGEWADAAVVPGQTYCYTPLLCLEDGDKRWPEEAVEGMAFAEAERFEGVPLPGAARLSWVLPGRVTAVKLLRLPAGKVVLREWDVPVEQTSFLDSGLPKGQPFTYRLRLGFGTVWGNGVEVTCTPQPAVVALPKLSVLPRDRKAVLRTNLDGLDRTALRVELRRDGSSDVVLSGPQLSDRFQEHEIDLPPWQEARFALVDARGSAIAEAATVPFEEVSGLRVGADRDELRADWTTPAGCRRVVALLRGTNRMQFLEPDADGCSFRHLPDGEYQVVVRTVTEQGAASDGETSEPVVVGGSASPS